MKKFAIFVVVLVAVIQFVSMFVGTIPWSILNGLGLTYLSEVAVAETVSLDLIVGLYHGFLGLLLIWTTFALGRREAYSLQWLLLTWIAVAGVAGAVSLKDPGILVFQSLPALASLVLIWKDRPYPKTEQEATRDIVRIERQILALKSLDEEARKLGEGGALPRAQHPKMHGLVQAEFTIVTDLPETMRVGIFAEPGKTYEALIRFSNARNSDDRDRGGHGMAIKLLNIHDGKSEGEPGVASQDFVLFDQPVFFIGNPYQYVEFEVATLRAYGKSKFGTLVTVILGYYWRHPLQLLNLFKSQRGDVTDPLAIRYWSVTPYKLGKSAVKYSASLVDAGSSPVALGRSADMLREALKERLNRQDAMFAFQIQVQNNDASMPVEDPAVKWNETVSPPVTVARIRIPRQEFDTEDRRRFAEHLSFTPWHALAEHAPLGGINRVRQEVYESLSDFRHALNRVPRHESTYKHHVD